VLLDDPEAGQGGLQGVAAAAAAGEAGGVDEGVVGQDRGRKPLVGARVEEGVDHDGAGDVVVGGDGEGVAGVVIEPGEDLGVGAIGQAPMGEVALPALIR